MRFKKLPTITALMMIPAVAFCQDAAKAGDGEWKLNILLISLVTLIGVLTLVILLLGNTVKQLTLAYRDKMRKEKNSGIVKTVVLFLVALASGTAVNAQETVKESGNWKLPDTVNGLPTHEFLLLTGTILLQLLIIFALIAMTRRLTMLLTGEHEQAAAQPKKARRNFWDRFNKVVPIEEEKDILLDHDYDGIQELDNSLPPWWKYGFYLTIVVAVIYMWYYHMGGNGPSSLDEYTAEVKAGEEAKKAYLANAANKVDENTVTMMDGPAIAAGETLFQSMCAACHAKDGGGGVGPNLADDYWLHGGSIQDIFKSIKYGWPDKGMKSWKDDFSPVQIAQISSYIKSLKGTTPAAPKEKQGELYVEEQTQAADTTANVSAGAS